MLVRTAVAAELCDVPTALLLAAHARDASSALILLTGIAEWFGRRRRGRGTDFELALDAAERLGIFARRQTWDRFRLDCPLGRGGRKHPSVRWGRGIFPDCRPSGSHHRSSGTPVTPLMLWQAAEVAMLVVQQEAHAFR
uniref:Uncharacterized protein n=1 Tax=Emiliania huxleyi TaxID=2903 RepID=A0A7S3T130_EMIHU